jgi:DNA-binding MarR family transcriptional regulator
MAASIVRLEQENQELRAEVAVAEQERAILVRELERLREEVAKYRASRLTDEDDYVQLTDKGRALLEGMR